LRVCLVRLRFVKTETIMKESRRTYRPSFIGTGGRVALALTIASTLSQADAAVIVKANNTNTLNLGTSWVGGIAPDGIGTDSVLWNNTVTAANSVALGGSLNWAGITIANPGGAVTVTHAANNALTLGSGGIDLSAATQNLILMNTANTAGTLAVGASQTWNVAASRALTLFATSNSANQGLTGTGNIQITTAGGAGTMGVVNLNTGDAASTGYFGGGNSGYSGNWTIGNGGNATGTTAATSVSTGSIANLRHGLNAWGSGTITLNGGQIASASGNWSWTNAITLQSGTTSNILLASGANRTLKLNGIISSSGNVNFLSNGTAQPLDRGYVLTGANTMSGTVTIATGASVRVGGVAETNASAAGTFVLSAGTTGTLGTAAVTNNGTLTLSRSDAWTFANVVSGSGVLNIGSSLIADSGNQVATVSGASSYTGATTVNTGRLNLTGSLTSAVTVGGTAKISGDGSTTGLLTLNSGAGLVLAGGATTTGLTSNGATFGGSNIVTFLAEPIPSTVYNVFTYGAGAVTNPGNLSVAWRGTLSDDVPNQKYIFTAGASGTRTWNTTSATWAQGTGANFAEGDQLFYGGDTVVFNEPASSSVVTLSGRLTPASVSVNNTTNNYTFSGTDGTADITGATSLTKTNAGTLIITSAQTYTGTTAVNGGIVDVGNGGTTGALGTGALSVATGAELVFNRSNASTVSNTISGAGFVTKKGAGRLTVNGNNSAGVVHWKFAGTSNGDIGFQNSNAIGGTGSDLTLTANAVGSIFFHTGGNTSDLAMSLDSGSVLTINGSTAFTNTYSGIISGAGSITKVSGEFVRFTGVNTYTGATTISAGTLEIGGAGQLGSGSYAGNIDKAATLSINTSANQTLSGVISGGGALTKANSGTLVLNANNTHSGNITVGGGILEVSANGPFRNGDGTAAFNSAAIVTINTGGTLKLKSFEYNGDGGLGGLRDYANNRVINGGTIEVTGTSQSSGNDFSVGTNGGVFRYNPTNPANTLTLTGNTNTNIPINGALTFQADGNISVAEIIEGTGGVEKTGSGTLELSGVNTYTGATTITAGTLLVSGSLSGNSAVAVNGGTLAGDGPVGAVTLNVGGTVAPGASPASLATGNVTFNGGTLALELNGTTAGSGYDQLSVTGGVAFSANTPFTLSLGFDPVDGVDIFTIVANDLSDGVNTTSGLFSFGGNPLAEGAIFTASGQDFAISYVGGDGNDIVLAAVPEPATTAILLAGLAMLGARRRRS
jgi:fibronectin-binding autotransporter adhesin